MLLPAKREQHWIIKLQPNVAAVSFRRRWASACRWASAGWWRVWSATWLVAVVCWAARSRRGGRLLVEHLTLVVSDFRIYVVDEWGVVLLAKDQDEGIHHLHQCAICIVAGCAGGLQCSYGYAHLLVGALQGESSYSLVGFLQVGYECRQA